MQDISPEPSRDDRLDSWKDIAAYLRREVRTVQLWEKIEGLPVHRHAHLKRGTVYAYKSELDAWSISRAARAGQIPAASPRASYRWLSGVVGLSLLCAGVWLGFARRPPVVVGEPKVLPLTSDPGNEMGGSFSPDGSQVAFAWKPEGKRDFDVYVKVLGSDKALRLTDTPDSDEVDPAWSPDGRRIAFYRSHASGDRGIYLVSPHGGPERRLVEIGDKDCSIWQANDKLSPAQLSWSPDGKWLAYPGISTISLETGQVRRLTSSPRGVPDIYPAFSPDGKSVAFVRSVNSNIQELYKVPTGGGQPVRVPTHGHRIYGVAWTTDGHELVYSSGKGDWLEARLWRVSSLGRTPPQPIAGASPAWLPAISPGGARLAFTRQFSETNIWEAAAPTTRRERPEAVRLIASTHAEGSPAISPNGMRIAFASNRSGSWQVWVCDRDGSNTTRLTSLPGAPPTGLPAWSPDGSELAFSASVGGNPDIYVISSAGGTPTRLTTDASLEYAPSWSRDARWLYFASDRTGRREIWKMPARGGSQIQLTRHGGQRPMESMDGRFVYYEKGPGSPYEFQPWRVPADGGHEEPVFDDLGSRWTVAKEGLYYYHQEDDGELAGRWFLKFVEFATGKHSVVAPLAGMPLLGHRPAISPGRRTFLYAQVDLNQTDLLMLEDFR
jgi:Tol biopolymer transport system component